MRWLIIALGLAVSAPAFAFWHGVSVAPPPSNTPTYYLYGF